MAALLLIEYLVKMNKRQRYNTDCRHYSVFLLFHAKHLNSTLYCSNMFYHAGKVDAVINGYGQEHGSKLRVTFTGSNFIDITAKTTQVFENLKAVAEAAGGSLKDAVKLNISVTDLNDFAAVNAVMASYFEQPYPARACVQVAALPKSVPVEIEMILVL